MNGRKQRALREDLVRGGRFFPWVLFPMGEKRIGLGPPWQEEICLSARLDIKRQAKSAVQGEWE